MQTHYDVTIITVRPATHPKALLVLEGVLVNDPGLLACWYSEIGALNQILIIRGMPDPKAALEARMAMLKSKNPFGVGEFMTAMSMDTFVAFDFLPPMQPGPYGPFYEVRSYILKTGGLEPTIELWRKAVPGRSKISPLLTAMTSVTTPFSLSRTASSTAISSKGFMLIFTLAMSTPVLSDLTRTFTLKSTTRLTGTRTFMLVAPKSDAN